MISPSERQSRGRGRYLLRLQMTTSCMTSLCWKVAMSLFMMGARSLGGRNPRPTMRRLGLRISRTCETSDRSMCVPSTGVASTHRRISIPMEVSRNSTYE